MENLLVTEENKNMLPIEYFSSSSIQEFLTNPFSFFTKYVLYDWEDKKGTALFIGSACHSALELYYNKKAEYLTEPNKEKKEKILKEMDQENIQNHALNEFTKLIGYQEKKGLEELCERKKIDFKVFFEHYQDLLSKPGLIMQLELEIEKLAEEIEKEQDPEAYEKINNEIISKNESIKKLNDPVIRAKGFLKKYEIDNEKLEYYKALYIDYGKISTTLAAKKEKVINDSTTKILISINNYFEAIRVGAIPDYKPLGTEVKVVGSIEGVPVPLKGSMDLLAYELEKTEAYPVDHKFVSEATNPEVKEISMQLENGQVVKLPNLPAGYIIQAGTYRTIAKEFLGFTPKKVIYDEVLKKISNPAIGLLKKDLLKLAEDNKEILEKNNFTWNSKTTNGDLADALLEAEVLKKPVMVNRVIIDFEKYPALDQIFLELYRRVLNQLGVMSIYKLPLDFLPNPRADFSGPASWQAFQKAALEGDDWKKTAQKGVTTEPEIKQVDF